MSDLKLNKAGGFNSIDDATNQLGGLGASSIGAVADSGKAAQPKDAQKWDRDYESVKKLSDTLPHPNTTFTPYSDEKAEAMKLYGVEPKVKEEYNPLSDALKKSGKSPILEMDDGKTYGVEYKDGKLYAGGITNSGIFHDFEIPYDSDFSVEENLQNLYDVIMNKK